MRLTLLFVGLAYVPAITLVQDTFWRSLFWTGKSPAAGMAPVCDSSREAARQPVWRWFEAFLPKNKLAVRFGQDRDAQGDLL
jgi:hypothetical protein